MGGLLAPSVRQDSPKMPPSGFKRHQEAARRPLRDGFLDPEICPKSFQITIKSGIMKQMPKSQNFMAFSIKMIAFLIPKCFKIS